MKNNSLINLQYSTIKTPLPNFIHQDLKTFSQNANLYQPQPQELINKLAQKHQLPQEMFFLTAGIDEALQMFAIAHGQNGFIFTPTYTVHADIKEFGGHLNQIKVISKNKYQVPTQKIPKATLIFLANPNNPSGFTSVQDVIKLVKNNRHCPVVIDEAYAEFADLSVIKHVPKNKTVVLGLVSTKNTVLENKDDLKTRIEEASQYIDIDQLALSPQCGFSSTVDGNDISEQRQWEKLSLVVETAMDVWGEV